MIRNWILCIACVFIVLASSPAVAQQRVWTETGEEIWGWEFVDDGVQDYMQTWSVPGAALALALDGRLVFSRGYTWDSPDAEIVQPNSLFRIASMSKPITSVAIHQLIERGLLRYDTRVLEVLDLQPPPGGQADPWLEEVTIDHLLYHTGGWDRDESFDPMFIDNVIAASLGVDLPISKADIATYMTGRPMQFEPGSRYAYSNYGYCLLGLVIEEITGRDYSEWVAENVFQPIGVGRPRRGHTAIHERAPGEVEYFGSGGEDPYRWNIENMDAHGGWIVAAPDYVRFMNALFNDFDASPLLSRQSLENMVEVSDATADAAYARGWTSFEDDGRMVYGHGGSLPGTLTTARWTSPGIAMVALINTRKNMADLELADPSVVPQHDLFESVGITDEAVGAALAESWIPVVANVGGAGGSVWRSDVALLNRSPLNNRVLVRMEMPGLAVDSELELLKDQHFVLDDVVSELGLSGSGSLRVFSSEPLTITSRSYNVSDQGTFGQALGGVTGAGGLMNGETAMLMHLREDAVARSNIGILNAGRRETRVRIVLFDGSGDEVARLTRRVDPRQVLQLHRPFESIAGRTDIEVGYAVAEVLDGEEVVVYGSVVDSGTNDPTSIPMMTHRGSNRIHVAAAARSQGAENSVWRSDLGLLNPGDQVVEAEVIFHSSGRDDVAMNVSLASGEHRLLDDVVGRLGGEGSGSVEVTADQPVLVSSRTYNQSPEGSFGQYLDGIGDENTFGAGAKLWLAQLKQNEDFRTNIGVYNTGDVQAVVRVHLYDADGSALATAQRTIAPGKRIQLQEPFDRVAGRDDITSGYAVVEVGTGRGITAYASVVDNRTNDPTTVRTAR
jgi:CubicO group peptidase (beta-lactamase class C family)